ncbi:MAG: ABC transporter substrate-binding protein [Paracoccaceae bacterium]
MIRSGLITFAAAILAAWTAAAEEIVLSCGTYGSDSNICESSVERWERKTGHKVRYVQVPRKTNDQLDFFRMALAQPRQDEPLDVVMVDAIWINFVEQYLIDLALLSTGAEAEHFKALIDNATFEDGLKAMPLWTGVGLMYYRSDLLEKYGEPVPRSWDELEQIAARVQEKERRENPEFWGLVFEATNGEGLTCNALEWLTALGGPAILDEGGKVAVDAPEAMQTYRRVKGWLGRIAPPKVVEMNNEQARVFFQNGNALFMRNWPYAWAPSQKADSPLKGKVGVMSMVAGPAGIGQGVHGGWYLGVSKHAKNPELAADLVLHMTSRDEQLQRALFHSQNPTRPALYSDPDVRAVSQFFEVVYGGLQGAVNRPNAQMRGSYIYVSNAYSDTLNRYLAGKDDDPTPLFAELQDHMARLQRRDW